MIQPSVCLKVVCYNNFIVPVYYPDFLFCNCITSHFANAVYEQCHRTVDIVHISCAHCERYFFTGFQTGKNLAG